MGDKTMTAFKLKNVNFAPAVISRPKMRTVNLFRWSGKGLLVFGAGMMVGSFLTLRFLRHHRHHHHHHNPVPCCGPEATEMPPVC